MSAPAPFCSSLYEDVAGRSPSLQVLPAPNVPTLLERHLDKLRAFYDSAPAEPTAGGRFYRKLLAVYYRNLIPAGASVLEIGCGAGNLLELLPNRDIVGIDLSDNQVAAARARVPHGKFHVMAGENLALDRKFDFVILSETLNFAADVQKVLENVHSVSHRQTRLILNFHSSLWRPFPWPRHDLRSARGPSALQLAKRDGYAQHALARWLGCDQTTGPVAHDAAAFRSRKIH